MFETVSLSAEQAAYITESSLGEVVRRQSLDDFGQLLDALKEKRCIRVIPDPQEYLDDITHARSLVPAVSTLSELELEESISFFQRLLGK